ncbi:uncharacterized protein LOC144155641 [Haemaphysalis longicornis]
MCIAGVRERREKADSSPQGWPPSAGKPPRGRRRVIIARLRGARQKALGESILGAPMPGVWTSSDRQRSPSAIACPWRQACKAVLARGPFGLADAPRRPLFPGSKNARPRGAARQCTMRRTALLLCLLAAVDQRRGTASHHHAPPPPPLPRTNCYHHYLVYRPAHAVGGFPYPHPYPGHQGYSPPAYQPGPPHHQGYPENRHSYVPVPLPLPLPPAPPPPPPPAPPQQPPYYGPWVPPYPQPPPPRNVDPFPGKFLGMGSARSLHGGRDVELVCDLHGDPLVSNVVWVKATNTRGQVPVAWRPPPPLPTCGPCFCPVQYGCVYQQLDMADGRFFADTRGHQATLHIYAVSTADYGVYRCSATAAPSGSAGANTETVYQIVHFSG